MFSWLFGGSTSREMRTRCARCRAVAAEARLTPERDGWTFQYAGVGGGNGSGDLISHARARAIRRAFSRPWSWAKWQAADIHDAGGYCRQCRKCYCARHWSHGGAGPCPKGHFQSLDPHWGGVD